MMYIYLLFSKFSEYIVLFVLIKKGFGGKKLIDKHPNTRLQFHFEDNMYMDALDKSIDINNFLFENKDIKKYCYEEYKNI